LLTVSYNVGTVLESYWDQRTSSSNQSIYVGRWGPHGIPSRAACGPRAAGWTALL